MKDLGHGADLEKLARILKKDTNEIIDFSSNINPTVNDDLKNHIVDALDKCKSYPDIEYANLKNNISKYINIKSDYIIPGNGATEILNLFMKSISGKIAILNPTFSEYERSARLNGLSVLDLYLVKEDFKVNISEVKNNINEFYTLFICNPNNPSGNVQSILELLELLKKEDKFLIVDETFMEFVKYEEEYSLIKYVNDYDNILIIKAITKFFGLPGLRLGYGVTSNTKILDKMYENKEPWTVNSIADYLSNYMFVDKHYIKESKNYISCEREYVLKNLRCIKDIKVYNTDTNFVLIKLYNYKSNELKRILFEKENVLIRDASNFKGLDDSYIRIAIKSRECNEIMIKAFQNVFGEN